MKAALLTERVTALTVAVLLIVTALGNAQLMFAVALCGVIAGVFVFRHSVARSSVWISLVSAAVAVVIAVVLWLR